MFLLIAEVNNNSHVSSSEPMIPRLVDGYTREAREGFSVWRDDAGVAVISRAAHNCVTSDGSCVLLDQLYASGAFSANGESSLAAIAELRGRWRSEGIGFLKDLNGSFALALHDAITNEVLVTTDRFSTYPLWHCMPRPDCHAISSDFTALSSLIHGTIDYASLWSFLTRARPVGQHSFYNEIKAIRPATALLFKGAKLAEETEWYQPRFEPEYGRPLSYWVRS